MIHIEISEGCQAEIEAPLLKRAAESTLRHQSAREDTTLTIVITGDDQIQALNRRFRDVDAPTDVLAFPGGHFDPETGQTYLGDVILSHPRAAEQANRAGHPVEAELQLLVIHGVLHLLGHDHAEPGEKAEMWAAQGEILSHLGMPKSVMSDS